MYIDCSGQNWSIDISQKYLLIAGDPITYSFKYSITISCSVQQNYSSSADFVIAGCKLVLHIDTWRGSFDEQSNEVQIAPVNIWFETASEQKERLLDEISKAKNENERLNNEIKKSTKEIHMLEESIKEKTKTGSLLESPVQLFFTFSFFVALLCLLYKAWNKYNQGSQ